MNKRTRTQEPRRELKKTPRGTKGIGEIIPGARPKGPSTLLAGTAMNADLAGGKRADAESLYLARIVESSEDAIIGKSLEGVIRTWNRAAEKIYGYTAAEIIGQSVFLLVPRDHQEELKASLTRIKQGEEVKDHETTRVTKGGRHIDVSMTISPLKNARGEVIGASAITRDISDRKRAERYQILATEILGILNEPLGVTEAVNQILAAIKQATGVMSLGIRLRSGDDFPYFAQDGFSPEFLRAENTLIARDNNGAVCRDETGKICLECSCGMVISGQTDPANPLFTKGGSCWINNLPVQGLPANRDPRIPPRNKCLEEGSGSVALIPIHANGKIIGLLQINDRRKDAFTPQMIQFLEGISASIGVAITRKHQEEAVRESETAFRSLAESVPQLVWMCTSDGMSIYFNQRWVDYTGLTLEESYGSGWNTPFHPDDQQPAWNAWNHAVETGDTYSIECRLRRADGTYHWFLIRGVPLRDATNRILKWFGTCTDIDDLKQAEEALRLSEARLMEAEHLAHIGSSSWDVATDTTTWSDELYGIVGKDRGESAPTHEERKTLYAPESWARLESAVHRALATGEPYDLELEVVRPDGTRRQAHARGATVRSVDGRVVRLHGTLQDITERKRAEEELQANRQLLRTTLDSLFDAVFVLSLENSVILDCNRAATEMFGYRREEMLGQNVLLRHVDQNALEAFRRHLYPVLAEKGHLQDFEFRMKRKDGTIFPTSHTVIPLRDKQGLHTGWVSVVQDITERKRAEEALIEERRLLHTLMDNLPDLIYFKDRESRFTRVNLALAKKFSLDQPAQAVGKTDLDFLGAEHADEFHKDDAQLLRTGQPIVGKEEKGIWPDGQVTWVSTTKMPLHDADGNIIGTFGVSRDITGSKQVEEALRKSEERFRLFMNNSPTVAWMKDEEGHYVYLSENFQQRLGVRPEDWLGKTDFDVYPLEVAERYRKNDQAALAAGQSLELIEESPRPGQGQVHWLTYKFPFRDASGQVFVAGIGLDVTERKLAEAALLESEERFRTTFEHAGVGMVLADLQGHFIKSNPAFQRMLGYSGEELACMVFTEFTHPDDRDHDWELFSKLVAGKHDRYMAEKRYLKKSGGVMLGLLTGTMVKDRDGRPLYGIGMVQDITERKQAEAALQESEERFRSLVENATVGIYRTTPEGRILMANSALIRMLGYANFEELASRNLEHDGFEPDYPRRIFRERVEQDGEVIGLEERWVRQDGSVIFVRESARAIRNEDGKILHYDGIVEDITERKRTEEALRLTQFSMQHASDSILWVDSQGQIVYVNDAACRSLGRSREELLSLSIPDIDPLSPKEAWAAFWQAIKQRGSMTFVTQHSTKEGRCFPVEVTANYLEFNGKEYSFAFAHDITERERAEAEHIRLVTAIEQSAEGVVITNTSGEIEYVNPAFTRITGYSREEALGQNPRILKSGHQDAQLYQQLWATILQGKTWHGELINRRKDGSLYTEQMGITPILGARGEVTHFIATKQDVSERKALEVHLQQAAKMEAVGRLAGGVAHDFNNLLTIINGYSELLLDQFPAQEPAKTYLAEVKDAGERAASLTRQLLAFSRRQVLAPQVLDLNVVVSDLQKMLTRLIGEDVKLRTNLDPSLSRVKADPGQIEQVIMNLAVNARDAMPSGGDLTLETRNVELDEDYARSHATVKPGPHVMLAVSDTGVGMTPEIQARIFEPFFTTKEQGKGTGLGLATVYGIVKQSGGSIWVYSEQGQGTVFKVYFPIVTEELSPSGPASSGSDSALATETVLVVEDQEGVRSLVRLALASAGYEVLETEDAEGALAICANYGGPIHLLLTDVVMHKMSGPEVAGKVAALRPAIKVLFMSGYTDDAIVHHGVLGKDVPFIQKPFSPVGLRKKIREVLGLK